MSVVNYSHISLKHFLFLREKKGREAFQRERLNYAVQVHVFLNGEELTGMKELAGLPTREEGAGHLARVAESRSQELRMGQVKSQG